jgi:hypothetical protein
MESKMNVTVKTGRFGDSKECGERATTKETVELKIKMKRYLKL